MKCRIKLNSVNDVKEFVNITFKAKHDVDLICGKYYIDGKSIMGIFSLPLDQPIEMQLDDEDAKMLKSQFDKFVVD